MVSGELLFAYDILLVDLYGVIWSGACAFPKALAALEELNAAGKKVVILSNASSVSSEIIKKYDGESLRAGTHFTNFVTSGDVMRDAILNGELAFANGKNSKKYFIFGLSNDAIFAGSSVERTEDLDGADFVYVSIPRFSDEEREAMPDAMRKHLYVAWTNGGDRTWDSTSIEPYIPSLKIFLEKGKPLAIANPDKFAVCSVLPSQDAAEYVTMPIAKQGLIAEAYAAMGGEVFATGKPFPQIYGYALEKLAKTTGEGFDDIHKKRIAMVGDTIDTDILGAKNASAALHCSIEGILVLTGISAESISRDAAGKFATAAMDELFSTKGVTPTHVISALDLEADVYF
ncbi:MAG: HAD hydrolase-like protein [Puniceicoccales bacterium]|jgi:HAD superfamily hydrolase (TIGR01450 family)|nr:HAD hydrolase-like protein [Puniceicoccales bacterium]